MNRFVAYLIAAVLTAGQVGAVTLAECDRTTHVSHGGETGHRDFGAGRVGFAEWWSQEGVFTDLVIADCGSGDFLRTRVREDSISDRWFDRTDDAVAIIMTEMEAAQPCSRSTGWPDLWSASVATWRLRRTAPKPAPAQPFTPSYGATRHHTKRPDDGRT